MDSFGLELDGVDLLSGASEEPLAQVIPELLEALEGIALTGRRTAQLSLHEAHLELAMVRAGAEVEVSVVSLARPARLVRRAVRVELSELCEAAVRCGRSMLRDLAEVSPKLLRAPRNRQLDRRLRALESKPHQEAAVRVEAGYGYRRVATGAPCFGFELSDPEDLLLAYDGRSAGGLPSLLCGGEVTLRLGEAEGGWRGIGPPFLLALELSRQAGELAHAIELCEDHRFSPGGLEPALRVFPARREARLDGRTVAVEPERLARAMFELGLEVAFAATTRNKAQAKNPYLVELVERCREGLSQLRGARPPAAAGAARATRERGGAGSKPLRTAGRLRRLRFEPRWEKTNLGGEGPGRLLLSARGPIFSSAEMACGFSPEGELLFRRVATHGVAASSDAHVVTATLDRAVAYLGGERSARWLKDHDGLPIGPELFRKDGLLITPASSRGALAFSEVTGREVWRIDPPRTQRSFLSLQGHRALLATDSGQLYGLDLADGEVRFRMKAALPFAAPTVPWGKRLLALLARGERCALFAADAHSGALGWTCELSLASPSPPLASAGRVLIAGRQDGHAALVCLGAKGLQQWQRKLPLGAGPLRLLAVGRAVLAMDRTGAAALVSSDGRVEWRVGAAGEELPCPVPPSLARGLVILPGETVRAVDPRGGRVLGEVRAGAGLCDVKVDGKLNLYLLDEEGTLEAFRLSSHFAVL